VTRVAATVSGSYLAAVETSDYFSALHDDSEALALAQAIGTIAAQLFEFGAAYPGVYAAVRYAWEHMAGGEPARQEALLCAAVMLMLREAGVMPGVRELSAAGVSLSGPAAALWREVSRQPRHALAAPQAATGEVAAALRQYLHFAFPMRRALFEVH
jgi:recombinational DNA repair protein (RecF pathway)